MPLLFVSQTGSSAICSQCIHIHTAKNVHNFMYCHATCLFSLGPDDMMPLKVSVKQVISMNYDSDILRFVWKICNSHLDERLTYLHYIKPYYLWKMAFFIPLILALCYIYVLWKTAPIFQLTWIYMTHASVYCVSWGETKRTVFYNNMIETNRETNLLLSALFILAFIILCNSILCLGNHIALSVRSWSVFQEEVFLFAGTYKVTSVNRWRG